MSGSNEADRLAYKQTLNDLRDNNSTERERNAAEAVMKKIQESRLEQMKLLVSEALKGIGGVRLVGVQEGTGVYMAGTQEVVEYTSSIQLEVDEGLEQAAIAAMAALAETTKQDSFIVNYTDEYKDSSYQVQEGDWSHAANVTVQASEDLSPSQVAKLSEAFTQAGLGVTITGREITTSNFSELSDNDFYLQVKTILNSFNYGNAEAEIQNTERGERSTEQPVVQRVQQAVGLWYSGEQGYNKSSFNSAQQNDSENYVDRYGKETERERYYGEYYGATEEESSLDVPIQGTSVTPRDLLQRLQEKLDLSEQDILEDRADIQNMSADARFSIATRESAKPKSDVLRQEIFDQTAYIDNMMREVEKVKGRRISVGNDPYVQHTCVNAVAAHGTRNR